MYTYCIHIIHNYLVNSWGYSHRGVHLFEAAIPGRGPGDAHFWCHPTGTYHDIKGHWPTLQINVWPCLYIMSFLHKYTYSQGPDSVAKSEGNQNQPNSYRMQCTLYVDLCGFAWKLWLPFPHVQTHHVHIRLVSYTPKFPWDFPWFALGACDLQR